jgi:hypothetical protein
MSSLNNTQRLIIVVGLLLIASALALVFLRFGYVYEYTNCFRLFILNERTASFSGINDEWGLLARGGELGVLLGIVAPIALSTAAAFIHYGKPKPAVAAPKAVEL